MKTKKLIILVSLLLSGIIVSAQSYSEDNGKMKIRHDQTSKPHIEISEDPLGGPDIITSFGTWWQLLKLYVVPGMGNNVAIDLGNGTSNKNIRISKKDRRELPPLPGPNRYRSMDNRGNYNNQ